MLQTKEQMLKEVCFQQVDFLQVAGCPMRIKQSSAPPLVSIEMQSGIARKILCSIGKKSRKMLHD